MGWSRSQVRRRHLFGRPISLHRRRETFFVDGGTAPHHAPDGHLGLEVFLGIKEGVLHDRRVGAAGSHGCLQLFQICLYVSCHDAPPRRRR